MNRVIPRYVPANSIEDKLGFLITGKTTDGDRVYLTRIGKWGGIGEALFFLETLDAADSLKAIKIEETLQADGIDPASVTLVRVHAFLVPTVISEADLRRKRKEQALRKLTPEEIEAIGLNPDGTVPGSAESRRNRNLGPAPTAPTQPLAVDDADMA